MSKSLLIIGAVPAEPTWDLPSQFEVSSQFLRDKIPDQDDLKQFDLVLVMGRLGSEARALQFGGALRLAVEDGLTAALLYPGKLEKSDRRLVEQMFPSSSELRNFNQEWTISTNDPAFHEYFAVFGRSSCSIRGPSRISGAAVLGEIEGDPCAVSVPQGSGSMYVVPFKVADLEASYNALIKAFLEAIETSHGPQGEERLPEHLLEVRLPGEEKVLSDIARKESEVANLQVEASRLERYRHIMGGGTGANLEELTIEVLNVILQGTEVKAEDRNDVGVEDFWLMGPDGDIALAEVKGVGGHVRRPNVNQVDDHRDAHDFKQDAMPGLLIVNVFRNAVGDEAGQRELSVNPDVVAHAAKNNVLILRTRDLFYLLHRKMAGDDAGQELLDALRAGGGWLRVDEGSAELQT